MHEETIYTVLIVKDYNEVIDFLFLSTDDFEKCHEKMSKQGIK